MGTKGREIVGLIEKPNSINTPTIPRDINKATRKAPKITFTKLDLIGNLSIDFSITISFS